MASKCSSRKLSNKLCETQSHSDALQRFHNNLHGERIQWFVLFNSHIARKVAALSNRLVKNPSKAKFNVSLAFTLDQMGIQSIFSIFQMPAASNGHAVVYHCVTCDDRLIEWILVDFASCEASVDVQEAVQVPDFLGQGHIIDRLSGRKQNLSRHIGTNSIKSSDLATAQPMNFYVLRCKHRVWLPSVTQIDSITEFTLF